MIRYYQNIDISERNSFHVRQTAKHLVEFDHAEELPEIFAKYQPDTRGGALRQGYRTETAQKKRREELEIQAMSTLTPSCDNLTYALTGLVGEVGDPQFK